MSPRSFFYSVTFLFVLALVCCTSVSYAGASNKNGNPYGNGSFFPNNGTFNGVLRGPNLVGITQFSTGTNAALNGGPLYIYNAADGVYDDTLGVYATIDPSGSTMTAFISPAPNLVSSAATPNLFAGGGSFSASLSTQPPNQVYNGSGIISEITDSAAIPVTTTNAPFTISGIRISN